MQASEFKKYFDNLQSIKDHFLGVFSINTVPKKFKQLEFCVCNTSKSNTLGEHWFTIFKLNKNTYEIFDSLGVTSHKLDLYKQNFPIPMKQLNFNVSPVQDKTSINCGYFCIYFLIQRLHNLDLAFDELFSLVFEPNLERNDLLVLQFCSNLL